MSIIVISYISSVSLFLDKVTISGAFLTGQYLRIVTNLDVGNRFSLTITKWTHTQLILLLYVS